MQSPRLSQRDARARRKCGGDGGQCPAWLETLSRFTVPYGRLTAVSWARPSAAAEAGCVSPAGARVAGGVSPAVCGLEAPFVVLDRSRIHAEAAERPDLGGVRLPCWCRKSRVCRHCWIGIRGIPIRKNSERPWAEMDPGRGFSGFDWGSREGWLPPDYCGVQVLAGANADAIARWRSGS